MKILLRTCSLRYHPAGHEAYSMQSGRLSLPKRVAAEAWPGGRVIPALLGLRQTTAVQQILRWLVLGRGQKRYMKNTQHDSSWHLEEREVEIPTWQSDQDGRPTPLDTGQILASQLYLPRDGRSGVLGPARSLLGVLRWLPAWLRSLQSDRQHSHLGAISTGRPVRSSMASFERGKTEIGWSTRTCVCTYGHPDYAERRRQRLTDS